MSLIGKEFGQNYSILIVLFGFIPIYFIPPPCSFLAGGVIFLGDNMKKFALLLTTIMLTFCTFSFVGCKNSQQNDKVYLSYLSASAIMEKLIDDTLDYGLLPEPAATKLELVRGANYTWHRLDVQAMYDGQKASHPQAVLMVKNSILADYPSLINSVKSRFAENVDWAKQNTSEVISSVQSVMPSGQTTSLAPVKALTSASIDGCKIYWEDAIDEKTAVNSYLNSMIDIGLGMGMEPAEAVGDDFFYTGNSGENSASLKNFSFVVPDGAPAIAIAKFIKDNQNFEDGASFSYSVVEAGDISSYITNENKKADFVIMPINLASKLYKKHQYTMVSVITHGNLYLMSKNVNASGLKDTKIGVTGEGLVPDLTLKMVLKLNNLKWDIVS